MPRINSHNTPRQGPLLTLLSLALALCSCEAPTDVPSDGGEAQPSPSEGGGLSTGGALGPDLDHGDIAGVEAGVVISPQAGDSAGAGSPSPSERADGYPPPPLGLPQLRFPIADEDRALISTRFIFGVDHDPSTGAGSGICLSHDGRGFPACYDEHQGSDFMLEGGFEVMDAGSALIVAAASGVVVDLHDGEYDRCHAELLSADVSCDGHPMRANYITLRHEGGWESSYLHLKNGSQLVERGDEVSCGQPLALIGSSGYSSGPHLHFELQGPSGEVRDPFAGERSQPYSLWADEGTGALPLALCVP